MNSKVFKYETTGAIGFAGVEMLHGGG